MAFVALLVSCSSLITSSDIKGDSTYFRQYWFPHHNRLWETLNYYSVDRRYLCMISVVRDVVLDLLPEKDLEQDFGDLFVPVVLQLVQQ